MKRIVILVTILLATHSLCIAQDVPPMIRFGNFEEMGAQNATIENLIKVPKFIVLKDGCAVTGFDISGVVPGKEFIGPYTSETDSLTDSQTRYIKSLIKDGRVWFHHIHIKCKDGNNYLIGKDNTEFSIYSFTIQ